MIQIIFDLAQSNFRGSNHFFPYTTVCLGLIIHAILLKAHRKASSLFNGGMFVDYSPHKRRAEFQLHGVCDDPVCPLRLLLSEGKKPDQKVASLLPDFPTAFELIGDMGYGI